MSAPRTVVGAAAPHRSVQLEVSSHVTLQGEPVQVTLQVALPLQLTVPPLPTLSRQLEPRQTMLAPLVAITSQLDPSVQVASQVDPQLALHAALVHPRWHPADAALHPFTALQPHVRPLGHAQPVALHAQSVAGHPGPLGPKQAVRPRASRTSRTAGSVADAARH